LKQDMIPPASHSVRVYAGDFSTACRGICDAAADPHTVEELRREMTEIWQRIRDSAGNDRQLRAPAPDVSGVRIFPHNDPYKTNIMVRHPEGFVTGSNNPDGIYLHRCDALTASAVLRVKKWRSDRELRDNGARTNKERRLLREKNELIALTLQQIDLNPGEAGLQPLLRSYMRREKGIDKALLREAARTKFELREARGRERSPLRPTPARDTNGMHELSGRSPCGVALNEPPHVCKSSPTTIDR